jgi:hypothetical protein
MRQDGVSLRVRYLIFPIHLAPQNQFTTVKVTRIYLFHEEVLAIPLRP